MWRDLHARSSAKISDNAVQHASGSLTERKKDEDDGPKVKAAGRKIRFRSLFTGFYEWFLIEFGPVSRL